MKIDDYTTYYCPTIGENVPGLTCESRHMKANVARNNSKFKHLLSLRILEACGSCDGGNVGLEKIRQ